MARIHNTHTQKHPIFTKKGPYLIWDICEFTCRSFKAQIHFFSRPEAYLGEGEPMMSTSRLLQKHCRCHGSRLAPYVAIKGLFKCKESTMMLISRRLHTNKNILMNIIFHFRQWIPINLTHWSFKTVSGQRFHFSDSVFKTL